MTEEIIIAGFGGQGVLSMGKILAYSGLLQGKEVTWMPAYGPEQRGGTANVTVILSDDRISSPVLNEYDIAIIYFSHVLHVREHFGETEHGYGAGRIGISAGIGVKVDTV